MKLVELGTEVNSRCGGKTVGSAPKWGFVSSAGLMPIRTSIN